VTEVDENQLRGGDLTDKAFRIGLFLKGLNGLLETMGGILLLIIEPEQISRFVQWLTQGELSQDPNDFIANHILKSSEHLTGHSLLFGSLYLLSHGIVKLILVIEVLRDHLWAYKALIVVTGLFIIYQLYSLIFVKVTFSFIFLTIFDAIIIYLTQKEYRRHKAWHGRKSAKKD
jgi:uncharacterized membrane protein